MDQTNEIWQIESNGHVVDTNFEQMTAMIENGELLRMDRVRKGNLRWIEAGKVPSLIAVFNAVDGEAPTKPVITLTKLGPTSMPTATTSINKAAPTLATAAPAPDEEPVCAMHPDLLADYVCGTCFSNFCRQCPKSYGGSVKICPYCGAMCQPIAQVAAAKVQAQTYSAAVSGGFGFGDFIESLAYPFRFKTSLILGAVMYAFVSIGTGVVGFGGLFMMAAALGCFLLMNTLTFGVLSNTIENFAQGKVGKDFMPSFEDFSIWDDVVHPFFLMIGAYVSSFGPLIVLGIAAFFFVANTVSNQMSAAFQPGQSNTLQAAPMSGLQSDAARTVNPDIPLATLAAKQSEAVKELVNRTNERQKQRIAEMEHGEEEMYVPQWKDEPRSIAPEAEEYSRKQKQLAESQNNATGTISSDSKPPVVDESEQNVMRANETIQKLQKGQMEAVIGKTPETKSAEQWALVKQLIGYGMIFLLIGGICLLWGLFYFPAACAVAGYTQSFAATVNPAVGLDTIKRLGLDYVKILLMTLAILIMSGVVTGIFSVVFIAFDMPGLGNVPAKIITSLFTFYFSVVFSCVLGFALYKAGDRLKLPS